MADNKDTKDTKASKADEPAVETTNEVAPITEKPATTSPAIGDPFATSSLAPGSTQTGVTAAPAPVAPIIEPAALDMNMVHQLAVAMAAAQIVRTVTVPPTPGLDDTTKAAKPYVINSMGVVVDANGVPVPMDKVDEDTKAQASNVRLSVPGVQFATEEV